VCYKAHGECSEQFYQQQVEETLHNSVVSEEQRAATLDMLQRLQLDEMVCC